MKTATHTPVMKATVNNFMKEVEGTKGEVFRLNRSTLVAREQEYGTFDVTAYTEIGPYGDIFWHEDGPLNCRLTQVYKAEGFTNVEEAFAHAVRSY